MLVLSKELAQPVESGWESLELLQTTRMWWHDDDGFNHGLRLSCRNCAACGISLLETVDASDDDFAPRLDLYAKEMPVTREKRRLSRRFGKKRKRSKADCTSGHQSRKCCRYHMWVSFKEIGWDSWIVSPDGFDAYYCKGKCSGRFKPANTHTLVQTAVRKKANTTVPKPCCVPKRLTPLSLYHYDDSDPPELVMTTHKNMIVKSCACS